jgi:hypothetical protein
MLPSETFSTLCVLSDTKQFEGNHAGACLEDNGEESAIFDSRAARSRLLVNGHGHATHEINGEGFDSVIDAVTIPTGRRPTTTIVSVLADKLRSSLIPTNIQSGFPQRRQGTRPGFQARGEAQYCAEQVAVPEEPR